MSRCLRCLVSGLIAAVGITGTGAAQVATDGTMGPRLQLGGPDFQIGAGLGSRAGGNLFHSFERFSLGTGESATFSGPGEIRNVISRVTGGARSDIDGALRSTIPGADFFFVNPAGVMFGPNASLDVQGSFHVSTADELRFSDGAVFSATNPAASSLTVAAPEAFGFLGAAPSAISVDRSTLEVPAGEALSIIGGDITIDGSNSGDQGILRAEAGTIQLSAAGARGGARLSSGEVSTDQRADITVSGRSLIDASGGGGGTVRIRAGSFVVDEQSSIFADNSGATDSRGGVDVAADEVRVLEGSMLTADTFGSGAGGKVAVTAKQIKLDTAGSFRSDTYGAGEGGSVVVNAEQLEFSSEGFIQSVAQPSSTGNAGKISIVADHIVFVNEGRIFNGTDGRGDGGEIVVQADTIIADGTVDHVADFHTGMSASANAGSSGRGGAVVVTAQEIRLINGGQITSGTNGQGMGGSLTIEADLISLDEGFIGASTGGPVSAADAGSVTIRAGRLEFVNDGRIFNGTDGAGDGGDITVTAGTIFADVGTNPTTFHTGIASTAEADSTGASGNITVHADEIRLINGALIATSTDSQGDAGRIDIEVDELHLSSENLESESAIASATRGDGKGGIVDIKARGIFIDFGFIGANTFGISEQADAGSVIIDAETLHFLNEGRIFNGTNGAGDGGDIHVTANTIIADATVDHVSRFHTGIASTAEAGSTGASGNVTVRADQIRLLNGGLIATSSQGFGNAGNVLVSAGESLEIRGRSADRPSSISVSSQNPFTEAAVGNIEIQAPVVEVSDGGRIEAMNAGLGRSGGVVLKAQTLRLEDGAEITADTDQVDAGNLEIVVEELVELRRSAITTSAAGGEGGGGNILIHPRFVVLDGSEIVATARRGAGGSIIVVADNFIRSPDSVLDASSDLGLPGTVTISSPEVDLTGGLVVLEVPLVDAASLLRERCAARRDIGASSFTGVGRGGLPPGPDQLLMSDYRIGPAQHGDSAQSGDIEPARPVLALACGGEL